MTRYNITIEVSTGYSYKEHEIIDFMHHSLMNCFDTVSVTNVEKVSITPEEAIEQLKEYIKEGEVYGEVSADGLMEILNKVA